MRQHKRNGQVAFRPRARLMKLIGAELISDDVVAVTELVKNAHDADATKVTISFTGVTSGVGEITITDDGIGMDLETLLNRWMEPASSWKRGENRRTKSGRRYLGEKGVGRFASDKLAAHLELTSKKTGQAEEILATFDWDRFSAEEQMLSDVKCTWELHPSASPMAHGTTLRLSGLRSRWTERMFRRLSTRLTRLISPFEASSGFRIIIVSDEFPEYSGELRTDFLDRAPYAVDASFDGTQSISITTNGGKSAQHIWNGAGDLLCGPVHLKLFAFDLEAEAVAHIGPRMEVRAWLKEWTGVSIYRDGFRVWPYGEPHDDWLRLDQRRVNNPVVRLSNNQIVGFVRISTDQNPLLRDQTNREGLIHNNAFNDLRRLVYFVLQNLEAERQKVRHPAHRVSARGTRTGTARGSISDQILRLSRSAAPEFRDQLDRLSRNLEDNFAREANEKRRFIEGYSGLAALGQAAIGLESQLRPLVDQIRTRCTNLRTSLNGNGSRRLTSQLRAIESQLDILDTRLAIMSPMQSNGSHRRRRAIDIPTELRTISRALSPVLSEAGVEMELDTPRRGVLRVEMRPEEFHRILHILTCNSIDWVHRVKQPRIRVQARSKDGRCEIIFSDNGPGIPHELAHRVFEPLFSGKEGGRGMGLTIARDILQLYSGSIDVLTDRRRRGANVRLVLPQKRSRATVRNR